MSLLSSPEVGERLVEVWLQGAAAIRATAASPAGAAAPAGEPSSAPATVVPAPGRG